MLNDFTRRNSNVINRYGPYALK